jgi:hypothetical protein
MRPQVAWRRHLYDENCTMDPAFKGKYRTEMALS